MSEADDTAGARFSVIADGAKLESERRITEASNGGERTTDNPEVAHYAREGEQHDKEYLQQLILDIKQDRDERKRYSGRIFVLAAWWMMGVWMLLFWQGFGGKIGFFNVDADVLKILLGATTLKVLGLMWLVTKYLFSERRIGNGNRDTSGHKTRSTSAPP